MTTETLFRPLKVGPHTLSHRVVMAPLTRMRASVPEAAANALNARYYAQRATAGGLIVAEASQVDPGGRLAPSTPGIHSDAQVEGWRGVVDAIHARGGIAFLQLWHVGRLSHASYQADGGPPVAPSAVRAEGTVLAADGRREPMQTPRALRADELPALVEAYARAARNAMRAGFDGIEVHAANGYLLEQFIRDSVNRRADDYGGSVQNRIRLTLECIDAAVEVFGRDRVGIRLSPVSGANACPQDSNPQATYMALVEALDARRIAYLHFIEGNTGVEHHARGFDFGAARRAFRGTYVANNRYSRQMAIDAVASGAADAVAFGVPFISNPDLPRRLAIDAPLAPANTKTYYGPEAVGYTDYPSLQTA